MSRSRRLVLAGAVAVLVAGCDQATKWQAVAHLTDAFDSDGGAETFGDRLSRFVWRAHPRPVRVVEVVAGVWHHRDVENPAGLFSLMRGGPRWLVRPLLLFMPLILLFALAWYAWRSPDRWTLAGAALVLGGGLGNFLDRARLGYVVDFVHWHWHDRFHWPVFNVADAALTIGIPLLLVAELARARRDRARGPACEVDGCTPSG